MDNYNPKFRFNQEITCFSFCFVDLSLALFVCLEFAFLSLISLSFKPENLKTFLLPVLYLFVEFAAAQSLRTDWYFTSQGNGHAAVTDIAIDSLGNQYLLGYFSDTIDFDPGSGVYLGYTGSPNVEDERGFVLKLDVSNNFVWLYTIKGTINADHYPQAIKLDHNDNILISGRYYGDAWFDKNSSNSWGGSLAYYSSFIVKLTSSGSFLWAKTLRGKNNIAKDIAVGLDNEIYVSGFFDDTCNFRPQYDTLPDILRVSSGHHDLYLLKFLEDGTLKKVATDGGYSVDAISTLATDSKGNLVYGGTFTGTIDADFSSGVNPIQSQGEFDCILAKVDSGFNPIWTAPYGGVKGDNIYNISIDSYDNVYVCGIFSDNIDLDPAPNKTDVHAHIGKRDVFIQKIDSAGNLVWAKSFGGTLDDFPYGLAVSDSGEVYCSGSFSGTVDFDPGNGMLPMSSNGKNDAFIQKLSNAGLLEGVACFGDTANDYLYVAATGSHNKVLAAGTFRGTIDIYPGIKEHLAKANGSGEMFVLDIKSCAEIWHMVSASFCDSFTVPSGKHTYYLPGIYIDTVVASGCDSLLTIQLDWGSLNKQVVNSDSGLTAVEDDATYQWYNCSTQKIIQGETVKEFYPSNPGKYAVILHNGGCVDTTNCVSFGYTGINQNEAGEKVVVYPNPTRGRLIVEAYRFISLSVYTPSGILVKESDKKILDLSELRAGVYLLLIEVEEGVYSLKVIKN